MFAGPLSGKNEKQQCASLFLWTVEKGREILSMWKLDAATEKDQTEAYLERFREHVSPMANTVLSR